MLKRIKRLLKKRNNAGFTLTEVIIASALLGILMLGVLGFTQPVLKSVKEKEQNARAVMLAETIESYIASSTRYAYYVQTFSGVTADDTKSVSLTDLPTIAQAKYTGTDFPKNQNASLESMMNCLSKLNKYVDNYEIRCIGMRWLDDPKTGEKKLMLTNEVVDQKTCALDTSKTKYVFETCFYDGLYPVLEYKNYDNQYEVINKTTGALEKKYADEDVAIAPGLEITMNVYLDAQCYSTNENTRQSAQASFIGTTFADFRNISSIYTINKAGTYKMQPNVEVNAYEDALAASSSKVYVDEEFGSCYYPDTFIYYINRKANFTTPTPSSTP